MHIPHLCSVIRKLIGTLPQTFPDSTNKMRTTNSSQEYLTSTNNLCKINSLVQEISTDDDVLECVIKDLMESNDYSLEEVVNEYMGAIEEDLLIIREAMEEVVSKMQSSGLYEKDEEEDEEED
jgi:hypothetical protein